mgnify:CR=1 FL=1
MPIRIYALAKELKIDSKELVDICNKAGITGKGSALASLNDDEVEKVKSYLKGPTKKAPPAATPPPPAPAPGKPAPAEPKPFTRDDYIAPTGNKDKIPVIDRTPKPPAEPRKKDDTGKREPKRKNPVINVAPLPEVKQPEPVKPPPEPKAQKPDIRLSKDAMTKKGPLEHLTSERKDKGGVKQKGKKTLNAKSKVKSCNGNQPGSQKDITTFQTGKKSWPLPVPAVTVHFEGMPIAITGNPGFGNSR